MKTLKIKLIQLSIILKNLSIKDKNFDHCYIWYRFFFSIKKITFFFIMRLILLAFLFFKHENSLKLI